MKKFILIRLGRLLNRADNRRASRKLRVRIGLVVLAIALAGSGIYALGADERALDKAEAKKLASELRLESDKSAALVEQAKVKQDIIDNSNRAKDAIIAKGQYVPLTITTERTPEISSKHGSGFSEWMSKNILRVHIPYEVNYMIALDRINPIVTDEGLFVEFSADDFSVSVVPGEYSKMTPDKAETGLIPTDFDENVVLALITANSKSLNEEYINNNELLDKAIEETKAMLEDIAETFGSNINFVDRNKASGIRAKADIPEIKGEIKNEK